MALSYVAKRRLSILLLVVWLPLYVIGAVTVIGLFDRPHILVEIAVYIIMGVIWVLPFRRIFSGIGQADPLADAQAGPEAGRNQDVGCGGHNHAGPEAGRNQDVGCGGHNHAGPDKDDPAD